MNIRELIGKTIIDVRGFTSDKRKTRNLKPQFILFDDEETILVLEEQDYYRFHDCSLSAKELQLLRNKEYFAKILNDTGHYPVIDDEFFF